MIVHFNLNKNTYRKKQPSQFSNSFGFSPTTYEAFKRIPKTFQQNSSNFTDSKDTTKNNGNVFSNKNVIFATLGLAIIATGIAIYNTFARKKLLKQFVEISSKIAKQGTKITENSANINNQGQKISEISKTIKQTAEEITSFGNKTMQNIKEETQKAITLIAKPTNNEKGILTVATNVNGNIFNLATMINPIKEPSVIANFQSELRTQATRNILGLHKTNIPPIGKPIIRIVTAESKPFTNVGGLSSVPKEIAEELPKILTKNSNASFVLDTPMYLGRIGINNGNEVFGKLVQNTQTNQWYYQKIINGKVADNYPVNLIDTFFTKIVGADQETIRLFQYHTTTKKIPLESVIENFSKKQLDEIQKAINNSANKTFETPSYIITQNGNKNFFQSKVTYNLWENNKFNLDIPIDNPAFIYSNTSYNSGLEERMILFNKYLYEHMVNMELQKNGSLLAKDGSTLLRTDGLILNDWHTGPLAAMLRLDSIAKKYHGVLPKETANKLRDMPIISLIHNNAHTGENHEKAYVEKMLNMMFGQYTATIVPEAWTINIADATKNIKGINGNILNPLFKGDGICPLNMLVQFSDSIHPVSTGYAKEIAEKAHLGNGFEDVYRIRAKITPEGKSLNKTDIISYALKNNIDNVMDFSEAQILEPTYKGINNGLNKIDNILNEDRIQEIENILYDTKHHLLKGHKQYLEAFNKITAFSEEVISTPEKALNWKINNKKAILEYYKQSITNAAKTYKKDNSNFSGELNTWAANLTDLTDITENTPIFVTAGRIDAQKGYETYLEAIEKYIKEYAAKDEKDFPVFQIQGAINLANNYDKHILQKVIETKQKLAQEGFQQAANRIVLLDNGQKGKYSISKLASDFNVMASTFEPCGLTHKEFLNMSGAIPIGHDTGGIAADLKHNLTGLFTEYDNTSSMETKTQNLAKLFDTAVKTYRNKQKYAQMVQNCLKLDFTWAKKGGSGTEYLKAMDKAGMVLDNTPLNHLQQLIKTENDFQKTIDNFHNNCEKVINETKKSNIKPEEKKQLLKKYIEEFFALRKNKENLSQTFKQEFEEILNSINKNPNYNQQDLSSTKTVALMIKKDFDNLINNMQNKLINSKNSLKIKLKSE